MFFQKRKGFISLLVSILIVLLLVTGCSSDVQNTIQTETEQSKLFANFSENSINEENIYSIIQELSSPKYEGRMTGSEGNKLACEYIADYFKKIGLTTPKGLNNYMQPYRQKTLSFNETPTLEIIDKDGNTIKEYKYLNHFTTFIYPNCKYQGESIGEALFINDASQLENEDLIKDKILIIPENILKEVDNRQIIGISIRTGVKGLICEQPSHLKEKFGHLISYVHLAQHNGLNHNDGYMWYQADGDALKEMAELSEGKLIKMSMDCSVEYKNVVNVIGLLPGTDEKLKEEFILITAHMDHNGSYGKGKYLPGALDNASGTGVMMELARVLKENKIKPKKSILFIAFNGEEEGLLGSQWYARHPVYPLKNTVVINMDMVGAKADVPLDIEFADKNGELLADEFSEYAEVIGIKYEKIEVSNSDHISFTRNGIKAITLLDPDWETIHRPEDTIDKIHKKQLEDVAKLVLYYIDKNAY